MRWFRSPRVVLFCLITAVACGQVAGAEVDYVRQVKPLLEHHCYACHGALKQEAGLRLDTGRSIRQGGDSGASVVAGRPAESSLIQRIRAKDDDERMPQDGRRLTSREIAVLEAWIKAGARSPAKEAPQRDPRKHWSYQRVVRPQVPRIQNGWARNPVDAFLAARHEQHNLRPQPPADRHVLLRRLYLNLIGIPPTPAEMRSFLDDRSPQAYETVVDRLLDDPRYGERWGRHWMDVWRYSDWYGRRASNEIRYSQRHIWRWRDWIVQSMNADKGYDRMLAEMLAADEVAPTDITALPATGFLGRNWYKFDRDAWLFETVEKTSLGVLGLTMRCARCHDHKYDPISQKDYYRFRAFFEPHAFRLDPIHSAQSPNKKSGAAIPEDDGIARVYDADLKTPTYRLIRGDGRRPDKSQAMLPNVPDILGGSVRVQPVSLPMSAYYPAVAESAIAQARAGYRRQLALAQQALATASTKATRATAQLEVKIAEGESRAYEARLSADLLKLKTPIASAGELKKKATEASQAERLLAVFQARKALLAIDQQLAKLVQLSDAASKKKHATLVKQQRQARTKLTNAEKTSAQKSSKYKALGQSYPRTSTGRRTALARWLTDRSNPRTARVAVNHIWLRHFGRALVESMSDFGVRGKDPTHPLLLDWLSAELMDNGWRFKHIHRLLVTSSAYRMSTASSVDHPARSTDPQNRWLWRMNTRRMEAEVVRDSLLAIPGHLNLTMGGPDLDDKLGQTVRRRSLYFRTTPDNRVALLEMFDLANPNACYRRTVSIVPQQALALTNSPLAQQQSRLLARQLEASQPGESDQEFIRRAYWRVLNRPPRPDERKLCRTFLRQQQTLLSNTRELSRFPAASRPSIPPSTHPRLRSRENLIHVLFSHHDFVTIR